MNYVNTTQTTGAYLAVCLLIIIIKNKNVVSIIEMFFDLIILKICTKTDSESYPLKRPPRSPPLQVIGKTYWFSRFYTDITNKYYEKNIRI